MNFSDDKRRAAILHWQHRLDKEELRDFLRSTRMGRDVAGSLTITNVKLQALLQDYFETVGVHVQEIAWTAAFETLDRIPTELRSASVDDLCSVPERAIRWVLLIGERTLNASLQSADAQLIESALEANVVTLVESVGRSLASSENAAENDCVTSRIRNWLNTGKTKARRKAMALFLRSEFCPDQRTQLHSLYQHKSAHAAAQRNYQTRLDLLAAIAECFDSPSEPTGSKGPQDA